MGEVIGTTAGRSRGKVVVRFAYAAGATGILANLFLVAFFAFQAGHPEDGTSIGAANDLVGSLGVAFMIPVALSGWLPGRRLGWITRVLGVSAMAVLVVGGPLLVLGVLAFAVQAPIMMGAWMVLCLWLFFINRWLRLSGALRPWVARLGAGLLLPWMSWPQRNFFGAGAVLVAITVLGTPFRFTLLGRHLGGS